MRYKQSSNRLKIFDKVPLILNNILVSYITELDMTHNNNGNLQHVLVQNRKESQYVTIGVSNKFIINDQMKDDVAKFNKVGHASKTTLSNEGISRANKLICKKILRNE